MFRFIKKVFVVAMPVFNCNALKCVCHELIKHDTQNGMKLVRANADLMRVFVKMNKDGMRINADVKEKN